MQARQSVGNTPILGVWNTLALLMIAVTLVSTDLMQDEISDLLSIYVPKNVCGNRMNQIMANYCRPEIRAIIEGRRSKKSGKF